MKRRVSQKQLAEDLGVSQSLVSLVLNGRREGISEDSYHRIWEHAVKKGYAPKGMSMDQAPQGAASGRSVGVVLRAGIRLATQSNTYSHVHQGLYSVLRKAGISTVFFGTEGDLDEEELLRVLEQRNPLLGIVIFGEVKANFIQAVIEVERKVVSTYASHPGLCHSVLPNERQAVDLLVDHLCELGHKKFAWLGGNAGLGRNQARRQALREALHLRGIALADAQMIDIHEPGDRQQGYDAAAQLLKRAGSGAPPTAWVCHNGLMARGALQFALQAGLRVPRDVSIVATDMTRVCEEIHPYLTSASANPERIGEMAAELLMRPVATNEDENVYSELVLPSKLVVRETCGPITGARTARKPSRQPARK